jgi:hypothetical protein
MIRHRVDFPEPSAQSQLIGKRYSVAVDRQRWDKPPSDWFGFKGLLVWATTRSRERFDLLKKIGAEALLEQPALAAECRARSLHIDAVMDVVGATTWLDSLQMPP